MFFISSLPLAITENPSTCADAQHTPTRQRSVRVCYTHTGTPSLPNRREGLQIKPSDVLLAAFQSLNFKIRKAVHEVVQNKKGTLAAQVWTLLSQIRLLALTVCLTRVLGNPRVETASRSTRAGRDQHSPSQVSRACKDTSVSIITKGTSKIVTFLLYVAGFEPAGRMLEAQCSPTKLLLEIEVMLSVVRDSASTKSKIRFNATPSYHDTRIPTRKIMRPLSLELS